MVDVAVSGACRAFQGVALQLAHNAYVYVSSMHAQYEVVSCVDSVSCSHYVADVGGAESVAHSLTWTSTFAMSSWACYAGCALAVGTQCVRGSAHVGTTHKAFSEEPAAVGYCRGMLNQHTP